MQDDEHRKRDKKKKKDKDRDRDRERGSGDQEHVKIVIKGNYTQRLFFINIALLSYLRN